MSAYFNTSVLRQSINEETLYIVHFSMHT